MHANKRGSKGGFKHASRAAGQFHTAVGIQQHMSTPHEPSNAAYMACMFATGRLCFLLPAVECLQVIYWIPICASADICCICSPAYILSGLERLFALGGVRSGSFTVLSVSFICVAALVAHQFMRRGVYMMHM
jgi:hypothetical protein